MRPLALLGLALLCGCADTGPPGADRAGVWTIVVARDAIPSEATAARELREYLRRATSIDHPVVEDGGAEIDGPTIEVGPTRRVLERLHGREAPGGEAWFVVPGPERLLLYGGRPRGTLYAVYHYLEDVVGVRWWTPYEEFVPVRDEVPLPAEPRAGEPVFVYRDLFGIDGPRTFLARNRVNGHHAWLSWEYGGTEGYGPPKHVHDFYEYFPPEEYFGEHPEFYSEIGGMRFGGDGQLCLTNPELLDLAVARLEDYVAQGRAAAAERGEPAPRLFDFSQNDWGRYCSCGPCTELAEREGGQAGPLVAFLNALAERVAARHPDLLVDSIAYHYTFEPPRHLRPRDNVTIRLAGLHGRDFSKPASDPSNARYLETLRGWAAITPHLRVWDYAVIFGDEGEFPLPNVRHLADDFRLYRDVGVEGVFIQHDYPIASDLRDLKTWLIAKLLEDPGHDVERLLRTFTDGYYGAAGATIRRYVDELERAARRRPAPIAYRSLSAAYEYVDAELVARGQALFDEAASLVEGDPVLLRRVQHARLTLDRATLARWAAAVPKPVRADGGDSPSLDFDTVAGRYRATWRTQLELRVADRARHAPVLAEVDREVSHRRARAFAETPGS